MKERIDEWCVKLWGNIPELEELMWLCSQSSSPLGSITKSSITKTKLIAKGESSVSTPEEAQYYLKSSRFARFTEWANYVAVCEEAKRLLPIIKSIAKLESTFNFQSIKTADVTIGEVLGVPTRMTISNVIGVGDTVYTGFNVPPLNLLIKRNLKLWRKDGKCYRKIGDTTQEVPDFSFLKNFGLNESDFQIRDYTSREDAPLHKEYRYNSYINQFNGWVNDAYISETFSYFADEPSWDNLYKTYEMIKFNMDGILGNDVSPKNCKITKYHWVEEGELRKFKKAANNQEAEGKPRHSRAFNLNDTLKKEQGKPRSYWDYKAQKRGAPEPLMSLNEANILIKRLFKRWYELKLLEFRLAYFDNVAKCLVKIYKLHCFSRTPIR